MTPPSPQQGGGQKWPIERLVSAGGVVYRVGDPGVEVVLCGRKNDGVWGLPKGTPQTGESLEETALREVREETGLQVSIQDKIGTIEYWFSSPREGMRYHKTVHHYLMIPIGGSTDDHDMEYDLVEWFSIEEAYRLLSYENEVNMIRKAEKLLGQKLAGPERSE